VIERTRLTLTFYGERCADSKQSFEAIDFISSGIEFDPDGVIPCLVTNHKLGRSLGQGIE